MGDFKSIPEPSGKVRMIRATTQPTQPMMRFT